MVNSQSNPRRTGKALPLRAALINRREQDSRRPFNCRPIDQTFSSNNTMAERLIHPFTCRKEQKSHRKKMPKMVMTANANRCKAILWYIEDNQPVPEELLTEINHGVPIAPAKRTEYQEQAIEAFKLEKKTANDRPDPANMRLQVPANYQWPVEPNPPGVHDCLFLWELSGTRSFSGLRATSSQHPDHKRADVKKRQGYRTRAVGGMNNAVGRVNGHRNMCILWAQEAGDTCHPDYEIPFERREFTPKAGKNVVNEYTKASSDFLAKKAEIYMMPPPMGGFTMPPPDDLETGVQLAAPEWP